MTSETRWTVENFDARILTFPKMFKVDKWSMKMVPLCLMLTLCTAEFAENVLAY
jgi:hypothetical protein